MIKLSGNHYLVQNTVAQALGRRQKILGKGLFSCVYEAGPTTVLKISQCPAWHAYISTGAQYGLDKFGFFPRVVRVHEDLSDRLCDIFGARALCVELERLYPIETGSFAAMERAALISILSQVPYAKELKRNLKYSKRAEDLLTGKYPRVAHRIRAFSENLGNLCADFDFVIDSLRGQNCMADANGNLVVTDPMICETTLRKISNWH